MTSNKYRGVFFDAGNTLLRVHPSIGVIYSEAARKFGAHIPPEAIEKSFKELWNHTAPLVDNEGHRLTYEKERDWWKYLVRRVFQDLIEFSDFDDFFDYLFAVFEDSNSWRLYEEVPDVLEYIRMNKLKMGIISNWDSRLPSLCHRLGIGSFFHAVVVSSLVGYEKPHPAIFHIALEQTQLQPQEALYIGDDPFLDYQAARKAGLNALHLDRNARYPEHPERITSLRDLLQRL